MTYSSHVLVQHVEYICYRLPPRIDSIHRMTYCTALILDNTKVLHCKPHCNVTDCLIKLLLCLKVLSAIQYCTTKYYITIPCTFTFYIVFLQPEGYCTLPLGTLYPIVCQPHYGLVQSSPAQLGLEQQQMIDIIFPFAFFASTANDKTSHQMINSHKVFFSPCICKGSISPHLIITPSCLLSPLFALSPLTFSPESIQCSPAQRLQLQSSPINRQ